MTTIPPTTTSTDTSNAAGSVGSSALASLSTSFNNFITLLTTELKNQDPTNPLSTSDMTTQIAQLSGVQAQAQTNQYLQNMLAAIQGQQASGAAAYIGKRAEATPPSGQDAVSTLQNGGAEFVYNLPAQTTAATISIKDSGGNTVYTGSTATTAGDNRVFWSGNNSVTGAQSPDGVYSYVVTATDATGAAVKATTYTTGQITGVTIASDGTSTLDLGNNAASISMSAIKRIEEDPLTQTTTSQTPATGTNG